MPKHRTAFYTARKRAGLTQVDLSRLSGVAQGIISALETGRNTNPTWDVLSKLAQVLGVRPEQLIPYAKLPKIPKAVRAAVSQIVAAPLYQAAV